MNFVRLELNLFFVVPVFFVMHEFAYRVLLSV